MLSTRTYILTAAALILMGIAIATGYSQAKAPAPTDEDQELFKRMDQLYSVVQENYYDEVDLKDMFSGAMNGMLHKMDPHSLFVDVVDYGQMEEQYRGNYQGIGVSFIIIDDKITVMDVVDGGPSATAGLKMGDRIVEVEGESVVGITSDEVQEKLRGQGGTKVTVSLERPFHDELIKTTITRGYIPISSVDNPIMLDEKTGYVRVIRFARPTSGELEQALETLQEQGMERLVLDLRNNGGGLLPTAISLVDKFLSDERMVVFTAGRGEEDIEKYYTDGRGKDWTLPVVILINNFSASASEIVAGSLQDWDRAVVVGDTSFGKGIVQSGYVLSDRSRLLLTTSRYYTPTGRLIQRPYEGIDLEAYQMQLFEDSSSSTIDLNDNINADKPSYKTPSGRIVYGGGGITPDVVIEEDLMFDRFVYALNNQFITYFYARDYYWKHQDMDMTFAEYRANFEVTDEMLQELLTKARERDFEYYDREDGKLSDEQIAGKFAALSDDSKLFLKAELAQFYFGREKGYTIRRLNRDMIIEEAMKHFDMAKTLADNYDKIDPNHFAATIGSNKDN